MRFAKTTILIFNQQQYLTTAKVPIIVQMFDVIILIEQKLLNYCSVINSYQIYIMQTCSSNE